MKKSKKFLALLLAVIMLATVVPLTVFAATSGDWEYTVLEDGTAEITKYKGSDKDVTIPSEIDGHEVVAITGYSTGTGYVTKGAFENNNSIQSVTVPGSVLVIGSNNAVLTSYRVFSNCKNLQTVILEKGVLSIGSSTFSGCSALTNITLPNGLTTIGSRTFENCTTLTSVTLPNGLKTIGERVFYNCTALTNITLPNGLTTTGSRTFENCTALTSVTLPNGLTKIGDYAFYNCTALTNIKLPNGLTEIGDYAFYNCTSLKSVNIPNGVKTIGDGAFSNCTSLQHILIPDSVRYIGYTSSGFGTFSGCSLLESIDVEEGNEDFSSDDGVLIHHGRGETSTWITIAIYPEGKKDSFYKIPDYATSIGYNYWGHFNPFANNPYLQKIEIGAGVNYVPDRAIFNCGNIKEVIIPANVNKIGEEAFGYVYVGSTGFTKKVPDFTIYGVKGTEAERYANDNGFKFIEIDAVEPENPGDISGDGVVNANDAIMIQRHVAGLETLSADQLKAADLNNDGIVDAGDAIAILRIDAGLAS